MANHKKDKPEAEAEGKVNQPAGATVVSESPTAASPEVLSHQWQENSPALNTDVLAGYGEKKNLVLEQEQAEEKAEEDKKKKKSLSEEEVERRSQLDVSDPKYVNPDLDHHK
jgi:hypothetical protein